MTTADTAAEIQPPTTWQKVKAGVKGFFKTVMHYLPRGIIISGIVLGTSALLGSVNPSLDLLHAGEISSIGQLAGHIGKTLLIGSTIIGGLGAWQAVNEQTKQHNLAVAGLRESSERERGQERQITTDVEPMVPVTPMGKAILGNEHTNVIG